MLWRNVGLFVTTVVVFRLSINSSNASININDWILAILMDYDEFHAERAEL